MKKIKIILDKNDENYTKILEMLLFEDCGAKIINYEDDDQFENENTIVECNYECGVSNALSANNYDYEIID